MITNTYEERTISAEVHDLSCDCGREQRCDGHYHDEDKLPEGWTWFNNDLHCPICSALLGSISREMSKAGKDRFPSVESIVGFKAMIKKVCRGELDLSYDSIRDCVVVKRGTGITKEGCTGLVDFR